MKLIATIVSFFRSIKGRIMPGTSRFVENLAAIMQNHPRLFTLGLCSEKDDGGVVVVLSFLESNGAEGSRFQICMTPDNLWVNCPDVKILLNRREKIRLLEAISAWIEKAE